MSLTTVSPLRTCLSSNVIVIFPSLRTSRKFLSAVSSRTSRRAVRSMVSPRSTWPFGNVHFPTESRMNATATPFFVTLNTMPPDDTSRRVAIRVRFQCVERGLKLYVYSLFIGFQIEHNLHIRRNPILINGALERREPLGDGDFHRRTVRELAVLLH